MPHFSKNALNEALHFANFFTSGKAHYCKCQVSITHSLHLTLNLIFKDARYISSNGPGVANLIINYCISPEVFKQILRKYRN